MKKLALLMLLVPISRVFADGTMSDAPSPDSTSFLNPLTVSDLPSFLQAVLALVVRLGWVVVVVMIVYVGYKFVAAQGSEYALQQARTMFLYTLVGAVILLGAQVLATGVCETVQALGAPVSC